VREGEEVGKAGQRKRESKLERRERKERGKGIEKKDGTGTF
jgi:hypothetical protein